MSHYDVYGRMATADLSETSQNGRYIAQQDSEKLVPQDIMEKLDIRPGDTFLDIGCGLGLNLEPISRIVASAAACDHPNVIAKLKEKKNISEAAFYEGNFLDTEIDKRFSKILAYSVLHALPDGKTVYAFVDKALSLLDKGGRMLLGDLANTNKKQRFLASKRGKKFQKEWERLCGKHQGQEDISVFRTDRDTAVVMDDDFILKLSMYIRKKGYHAYILDQPQNLPFGNTREDILVVGPEYEEAR